MYDVVIVGGGAAGLSAALVLGRARRSVLVVDAGEPRNRAAHASHGFLTRDGIPPGDLLKIGREEVRGYGVEVWDDRVTTVEPGFAVRLAGGGTVSARRLLVTTGMRDELPDIPGVAELWGNDVHLCPYCHGWEVRDQPIGVVKAGPAGVMKAVMLRQWSPDVVLFPGDYQPTSDESARLVAHGIEVVPGAVGRLVVADGRLTGVEVAGTVVPRSAVFLQPDAYPRDELLRALGCETDDRDVVRVDAAGRTTVDGVWATGNVVEPMTQLVTAAGMGSATAIALNNELVFAAQPVR
jgi:thioredoxin reductase